MGEINFITKEVDSEAKAGNTPASSTDQAAKWAPSEENSTEKSSSVFGSKNETQDKVRIEKSRKEVLDIIDKNKKGDKDKKKVVEVPQKSGNWLRKFFGGSGDTKIPEAPKKNEAPEKSVASMLASQNIDSRETKDSPMMFNNNTWNSVGVLETNLIDKTDYSFFDTGKKVRVMSAGIFASIALVTGLYLGLLFWENMQLEKLSNEQEKVVALENDVKKLEMETSEAKLFQGKLDVASKILDKHIYMTNFFKLLEAKTLPNVFFVGSLALNSQGNYTLKARTDDYESMKNQLMIFSGIEEIKNIKLMEVMTFKDQVVLPDGTVATEPDPVFGTISSTTPRIPITKSGVEFGLDIEIDTTLFYMNNEPLQSEVTDEEAIIEEKINQE